MKNCFLFRPVVQEKLSVIDFQFPVLDLLTFLFSQAEPFKQVWWRALWKSFVSNYFEFRPTVQIFFKNFSILSSWCHFTQRIQTF